jgi:hypothetical protein
VATHFGDSAGDSTTSSTLSMKGGNSGNNGSDLDKGQHPQAHLRHPNKLFLSLCEVTRHETILKDTMPIVFNKPEVIPEVQPNPSPYHNNIQVMINSALERQAKSTDELLRRLIQERDAKNLDASSVNHSSSICTVSFT